MEEKKMPSVFWAEAVNVSAYLQNRSHTSVVEKKTPFEVFTGRKPGVKHLRVFGCVCYTHVPSVLRQKFDGKSEKGVFMGYGSCEKGYRVYILLTKKIIVSRDVIFDEDKSWNWKTNKVESVSTCFSFAGNEEANEDDAEQQIESNMMLVKALIQYLQLLNSERMMMASRNQVYPLQWS